MNDRAHGEFDVQFQPLPAEGDPGIGQLSIAKTFRGDLEATSQGVMISAMGLVQGSAGYVALERVTGTLKGRAGSFVLQHHGLMDRGKPSLSVVVVPDSGADGLQGLSGRLDIVIDGKKHFYTFDYELP